MKTKDLITACIKKLTEKGANRYRRPLPQGEVKRLMFKDGTALPTTLAQFLSFDWTFESLQVMKDVNYAEPDNTKQLTIDKRSHTLVPTDLEQALQASLKGYLGKPWPKLRSKLFTVDEVKIKKAIELVAYLPKGDLYQLPNFGDEENFLLVGKPVDDELPILGLHFEKSREDGSIFASYHFFLKYPSFDIYLGVLCDLVTDRALSKAMRSAKVKIIAQNPSLTHLPVIQ